MKSERGGVDLATFKLSVPSLKSELLLLNHQVVQRKLITTTRSVSRKEVPLDLVCSLAESLGPHHCRGCWERITFEARHCHEFLLSSPTPHATGNTPV